MKCVCENQMELKFIDDDPSTGFAYNFYHCNKCMTICKEDVWNNTGNLFISMTNKITYISDHQKLFSSLIEYNT